MRVFASSAGVLRVPDIGAVGDTRSRDARRLPDSGVAGLGLNRCGVLRVEQSCSLPAMALYHRALRARILVG
jgi:hypothetical protein